MLLATMGAFMIALWPTFRLAESGSGQFLALVDSSLVFSGEDRIA
jgi:hypothetical protein